jgi:hypothetical protein
MKHTKKKEDAALMLRLHAEATKPRQAGDPVLAKGGGQTTIAAIQGDWASLANGEQCHVSRLRSAPPAQQISLSRIEISVGEYEFNHGAKPRGRGRWAFYFGGADAPWWPEGGSMLYSEACAKARVEAKRRGTYQVKLGT